MLKHIRSLICSLAILPAMFNPSGCDSRISQGSGLLEGKISIGPICPVETVPPGPECLPTAETYKAYPVSILTLDQRLKVTQITPALDGTFSIELDEGSYFIVLEEDQNSIGRSNLPLEVIINPQEKTVINIDIDTGIR